VANLCASLSRVSLPRANADWSGWAWGGDSSRRVGIAVLVALSESPSLRFALVEGLAGVARTRPAHNGRGETDCGDSVWWGKLFRRTRGRSRRHFATRRRAALLVSSASCDKDRDNRAIDRLRKVVINCRVRMISLQIDYQFIFAKRFNATYVTFDGFPSCAKLYVGTRYHHH
jgi:hypothetical protein